MPLKRIKIEELEKAPPLRGRVSLAQEFPEVAAKWLHDRNKGFKPNDFSSGSNVEVWFKCPEGVDHIFRKAISSMVMAARKGLKGCPGCKGDLVTAANSLINKFPEIAKEYLDEKNDKPKSDISYGSSRRVWWCCSQCSHEWQTSVSNRTQLGSACPACSGRITFYNINKYPSIKFFFDPRKNREVDPSKIPSNCQINWVFRRFPDHVWTNGFSLTNMYDYCPFCRGSLPSANNNLALFPDLLEQIDRDKSPDLKPEQIPVRSTAKVWWKCPQSEDHQWESRVVERVFDERTCPFCTNTRVCPSNSLQAVAPEIAAEWCQERNGDLTPDQVPAYSGKSCWFTCSKSGHKYCVKLYLRTRYNVPCSVCRKLEKSTRDKRSRRSIEIDRYFSSVPKEKPTRGPSEFDTEF